MDLAMQLRAIDVPLTDDDIIDVLIISLPDWYDALATSLSAQSGKLSLNDVTGAILDKQIRQNPGLDPNNVALTAHEKCVNSPQKCYNCGEPGHIARNCPKRQVGDEKRKSVEENSKYARQVDDALVDISY